MITGELRWARWATFAMFFANGFGLGGWASSIPPLRNSLGLSPTSLSVALLAVAVGAATMMQFCSALTYRLGGTGRATRIAGFAYLCALPLLTLSPDLPCLIAAATLLGASSSLMDVAMNSHAATVERRWAKPIMSSFHAGWSIGCLAGSGFGAVMIAAGLATWSLMLPTAAVVLLVLLICSPHLGPGDIQGGTASGAWLRLPELRLAGLAAMALLCFLVEGAMADWSGLYLTTIGVSLAAATSGYAAFSLTMVVGRLLGDRAVHAFGRARVVTWGALIAAAGLALAVAVPRLSTVVTGFALVGIGLSNVVPSLFSASARLGRTAAAGIAETSTAGYVGLLSGPPLIGAVASHWGLRSGVAVMALAAFAAALISLRSRALMHAAPASRDPEPVLGK